MATQHLVDDPAKEPTDWEVTPKWRGGLIDIGRNATELICKNREQNR